jgi:hypothetical protein
LIPREARARERFAFDMIVIVLSMMVSVVSLYFSRALKES